MEDKNKEDEPKYFTVTYHSEGHTSGEVPVDPKHYPAKFMDDNVFVEEAYATILSHGNLEKEGYVFNYWRVRGMPNDENAYYRYSYQAGDKIVVSCNKHIEASWLKTGQ
jgi:hypothetical protein